MATVVARCIAAQRASEAARLVYSLYFSLVLCSRSCCSEKMAELYWAPDKRALKYCYLLLDRKRVRNNDKNDFRSCRVTLVILP